MRAFSFPLLLAAILAAALPALPARAGDAVAARLDAARAAHGRGDLARALVELEAAVADLHTRLGAALAECLPPAPPGWRAEAPETQSLAGAAGGGLSVSRAYVKDESSMNATLLLDSPAVAGTAQMLASPTPPANTRRVRVGAEDALLRWDPATHAGEVTMVLGNRALLQIEGDALVSGDILAETARGWNLGAIRKLSGL